MSCEIGVDVIQPLISKRSVVKECNNEKITNVRSTSSVLSYEKDQRIVTIQITNSYGESGN